MVSFESDPTKSHSVVSGSCRCAGAPTHRDCCWTLFSYCLHEFVGDSDQVLTNEGNGTGPVGMRAVTYL